MPAQARTRAMITLLRRLAPARRRAKLPRQLPPRPIEFAYYKAIRSIVVEPIIKILDEIRGPMLRRMEARAPEPRADGPGFDDPFTPAARRAAQRLADLWKPAQLEAAARKFAERADDWNKKELGKQVSAAMGVKLQDIERPTVDRIPSFVRENVALIKTVPERALDRVNKLAQEAYATGMRPETMAERLQEIGDISENDAMRIARDQIGKLNAQVNQDRQQALGADSYVWRTVNDNRVRDEHSEREGQVFRWDDPPEDGHPGEPIQCRCWAEPVFDFLSEE